MILISLFSWINSSFVFINWFQTETILLKIKIWKRRSIICVIRKASHTKVTMILKKESSTWKNKFGRLKQKRFSSHFFHWTTEYIFHGEQHNSTYSIRFLTNCKTQGNTSPRSYRVQFLLTLHQSRIKSFWFRSLYQHFLDHLCILSFGMGLLQEHTMH